MDRAYWQRKLEEAEHELEEARTRTTINAAAKKLQQAKAELRRLEAELADRPKRSLAVAVGRGALLHGLRGQNLTLGTRC